MDFEQAMETLGIDLAAGPAGARRAYLRLLKKHKPERDPYGFQRVRAAYELVKEQIGYRAARAAAMDARADVDPSYPDSGTVHEPDVRACIQDEPERQEGALKGAPEELVHSTRDVPTGGSVGHILEQALDGHSHSTTDLYDLASSMAEGSPTTLLGIQARLEATTSFSARIEVAREAIATLPDEPDLRWLLYDELSGQGRSDEAASVLRNARDSGMSGFEEELLAAFPHLLTERDLELSRSHADPYSLVQLASAHVDRGDARAAADAVEEALGRCISDPLLGQPSTQSIMNMALDLFARAEGAEARRVYEAMTSWLPHAPGEVRFMHDHSLAMLAMLRELVELPDDCPTEVSSALARGVLVGDLDAAATELTPWARRHPEEAGRAVRVLMTQSLVFGRALVHALQPEAPEAVPDPDPSASSSFGPWWLTGVVLVALLVAVRACATFLAEPTTSHESFRVAELDLPNLSNLRPLLQGPGVAEDPLADPLLQTLSANVILCQVSIAACDASQQVVGSLEVGDCDAAAVGLSELEVLALGDEHSAEPRRPEAGRIERATRDMTVAYATRCTAHAPGDSQQ